MKFIAIADTHGQQEKLVLPEGDVVIHAGDISKRGNEDEVIEFLNWFKELPYKYKIFIAGNHDFFFERTSSREVENIIPENIIHLNDTETIINGIKIWGSPITPYFFNWAFNRHRGDNISRHWELIPPDANIVITHGPVYTILDKIKTGQNVGCEDLLAKIQTIKPQFHICGHIHEAYGQLTKAETNYINASVLDEYYNLKNNPIVFEM